MTTSPDTEATRLSEGQHLEWKASCRDDHLKSVCAFANAKGGTLEIGRDDEGKVVGVGARERRRLLEELPNKLRDLLGIVAPMDVCEDDGVPYLRIVVEPYPGDQLPGRLLPAQWKHEPDSPGSCAGPLPAREDRQVLGRDAGPAGRAGGP